MDLKRHQPQTVDWIDLAKGICILLVVYHHCVQSTYLLPTASLGHTESLFINIYEALRVKLVPLRMPLFFMISGFLVYRAATTYNWSNVFYKRIQTIFYVYLLWGAIQFIFLYFFQIFTTLEETQETAIISNYATSFLEYSKLIVIGSSSLWYLYALPIYFVICKLLSKAPFICFGIFLIINLASDYYHLDFPTSSIARNGIFYAIGCFLGPVIFPLVNKLNYNAFIYIFGIIAFKISLTLVNVDHFIINTLLVVSIMILFLNWFQKNWDIPMLRWIGRRTLSIYVIHYIILKFIAYFIIPYMMAAGFFNNDQFALAWYTSYPLIGTFLATSISLLIWKLTNRGYGRYLYTSPEYARTSSRGALN
ncbi:MAG: acyltransferase family protein [Paraglaciecola chathamensis]